MFVTVLGQCHCYESPQGCNNKPGQATLCYMYFYKNFELLYETVSQFTVVTWLLQPAAGIKVNVNTIRNHETLL